MMEQGPQTLLVVSSILPDSIQYSSDGKPRISEEERAADALDDFNHPRFRQRLILQSLAQHSLEQKISFQTPAPEESSLECYESVHSKELLLFLSSAWMRWEALGEEGQDPASALRTSDDSASKSSTPALIPINVPLGREQNQRPSNNVMGQIGYYCTDTCTPIFASLQEEMIMDASVVQSAVHEAVSSCGVVYAIQTHPGHHAARDSFGGYCYVNHAACAARMLQSKLGDANVAILDVDYHCGNGTASIFYNDPSVLVVSIHCDPDCEYPFHSGHADQTGANGGVGATLHLPLTPKTDWIQYQKALDQGMDRIISFGAKALVVSLGLDTYDGDPCAVRRSGFSLSGSDYGSMGQAIGERIRGVPILFVQEGGYRMDAIGKAAADVVVGCFMSRHM